MQPNVGMSDFMFSYRSQTQKSTQLYSLRTDKIYADINQKSDWGMAIDWKVFNGTSGLMEISISVGWDSGYTCLCSV